MDRARRVFLSHTSELRAHPEDRSFVAAAEAAVARTHDATVDMASFTAVDAPSADYCIEQVRACDVYVGLLGFRYGSPVRDRPDVSYTELEFETATAAGMPRLVFLVDEEATGLPASALIDREYGPRQDAFRARVLDAGLIAARVKTPDQLETLLFQALVQLPTAGAGPSGPEPRPPPFMAPPPPATFVPRPTTAQPLLDSLLGPSRTSVALLGPGGFGKTTLAEWLCHEQAVRDRFPDGVLWATVGSDRSSQELVGLIGDLCLRITGERPSFSEPHQAGDYLGEVIGDRRALLVLDDVWQLRDVEPFLLGAPNCSRLVTTRAQEAVPPESVVVPVESMTDEETVALLLQGITADPARPADLRRLLAYSGNWPVLTRLISGALADEVSGGASFVDAVHVVEEGLREGGPVALDITSDAERDRAVAATVDVGLRALTRRLGDDSLSRYLELAVFAEDIDIPLDVLGAWWHAGTGWTAFQLRQFCRALLRLSLIRRLDTANDTIRLHNVIRAYLRHRAGPDLPAWHAGLLDAFRSRLAGPSAWWTLPDDAAYPWSWAVFHLAGAGHRDELAAMLVDGRYLVAKTALLGAAATEVDLNLAANECAGTPEVVALQRAYRQTCHLLGGFGRRSDLAATLVSRLSAVPALAPVATGVAAMVDPPHLVARVPLPDRPDPRLVRTLGGHEGWVHAAALDAGGSRVASAGEDGTVRVWDAASGRLLAAFTGHEGWVHSVTIDDAASVVASAGADGTVRAWSRAGEPIAVLGGHAGAATAVALDPSGTRLATGDEQGAVRLWDVAGGTVLQTRPGAGGPVTSVTFDPAGARIAVAGSEGTVALWAPGSPGAEVVLRGHTGWVHSAAFRNAGAQIVSAGEDGTVRLWDATTGAQLRVVDAHAGWVTSVGVGPTGQVVSSGEDGFVRLWDLDRGSSVGELEHRGWVTSVALGPAGEVLSASESGAVRLWDPGSAGPLPIVHGHRAGTISAVVSATGQVVCGGPDGQVRVWDASTGEAVRTLALHRGGVTAVDVDAAGVVAVSGGIDGLLTAFDLRSGEVHTSIPAHPDGVTSVAVDAEGRRAVTVGGDGPVRVWALPAGTALAAMEGHQDWVHTVAFAPTGNLVASGSEDRTVRLWDLATGAPGRRLESAGAGVVWTLAFDRSQADGARLAAAGEDGDVWIWDTRSATVEARMHGHAGWVRCVAFHPTGRWLLSVGDDQTVRVWDVATAVEVTRLRVDASLACCAWGADDTIVAGGDCGLYLLQFVATDSRRAGSSPSARSG